MHKGVKLCYLEFLKALSSVSHRVPDQKVKDLLLDAKMNG